MGISLNILLIIVKKIDHHSHSKMMNVNWLRLTPMNPGFLLNLSDRPLIISDQSRSEEFGANRRAELNG
jgi:hypothetical protein